MRPFLVAAIGIAVAAGGAVLLAPLAQRRLLYFPDRYGIEPGVRVAAELGLQEWRDAGGRVLGWRSPHPTHPPVARAIVLHGNAGSALSRSYLRDVLQGAGSPPLEVLLLEYPGYGARGGTPGERSLVDAAVQAIDAAAAEGGRVLLVGESLGSAVAALAAAERPAVAGCILITPLKSAAEVARIHFPWIPSSVIRDRFDAAQALSGYGGPIAFLIAGEDEVVFPDLGRALYDGFSGPKRLWVQDGRRHNSVTYDRGDPMWREMVEGLLTGRF